MPSVSDWLAIPGNTNPYARDTFSPERQALLWASNRPLAMALIGAAQHEAIQHSRQLDRAERQRDTLTRQANNASAREYLEHIASLPSPFTDLIRSDQMQTDGYVEQVRPAAPAQPPTMAGNHLCIRCLGHGTVGFGSGPLCGDCDGTGKTKIMPKVQAATLARERGDDKQAAASIKPPPADKPRARRKLRLT